MLLFEVIVLSLGQNLYTLRKQRGYSQEYIASVLGVSRQAVSKWESDAACPEMEKLLSLCELLGVSLDELVRGRAPDAGEGAPEEAPAAEGEAEKIVITLPAGRRVVHYESKARIGSLPLVCVHAGFGKNHRIARGVIAIGLISQGVVSIGLVSMGLLSIGFVSLGLLAFGLLALGLAVACGTIALGTFAMGAIALGYVSWGALSAGVYSLGAVAGGSRVAVGYYADAPVAIGRIVNGLHTLVDEGPDPRSFPSSTFDGEAARALIRSVYPGIPGWVMALIAGLL